MNTVEPTPAKAPEYQEDELDQKLLALIDERLNELGLGTDGVRSDQELRDNLAFLERNDEIFAQRVQSLLSGEAISEESSPLDNRYGERRYSAENGNGSALATEYDTGSEYRGAPDSEAYDGDAVSEGLSPLSDNDEHGDNHPHGEAFSSAENLDLPPLPEDDELLRLEEALSAMRDEMFGKQSRGLRGSFTGDIGALANASRRVSEPLPSPTTSSAATMRRVRSLETREQWQHKRRDDEKVLGKAAAARRRRSKESRGDTAAPRAVKQRAAHPGRPLPPRPRPKPGPGSSINAGYVSKKQAETDAAARGHPVPAVDLPASVETEEKPASKTAEPAGAKQNGEAETRANGDKKEKKRFGLGLKWKRKKGMPIEKRPRETATGDASSGSTAPQEAASAPATGVTKKALPKKTFLKKKPRRAVETAPTAARPEHVPQSAVPATSSAGTSALHKHAPKSVPSAAAPPPTKASDMARRAEKSEKTASGVAKNTAPASKPGAPKRRPGARNLAVLQPAAADRPQGIRPPATKDPLAARRHAAVMKHLTAGWKPRSSAMPASAPAGSARALHRFERDLRRLVKNTHEWEARAVGKLRVLEKRVSAASRSVKTAAARRRAHDAHLDKLLQSEQMKRGRAEEDAKEAHAEIAALRQQVSEEHRVALALLEENEMLSRSLSTVSDSARAAADEDGEPDLPTEGEPATAGEEGQYVGTEQQDGSASEEEVFARGIVGDAVDNALLLTEEQGA